MSEKKYKWHKIADDLNEIEFSENNIAIVNWNGKNICIGKYKEAVFAFAYKCPHAGGILADGYIDVLGNVVCPVHRYKYNMANGRNTSGEGYFLKHWPLEIKDDGLYIGTEENAGGLFGLFK